MSTRWSVAGTGSQAQVAATCDLCHVPLKNNAKSGTFFRGGRASPKVWLSERQSQPFQDSCGDRDLFFRMKWGGRWDSNPVPRITGPVLRLMSYGHRRIVRGSRPTRFELAPTLYERGALSI
jgi:hypothetical protein